MGDSLLKKDPQCSFPEELQSYGLSPTHPGVSFFPTDVKDQVPWARPLNGPMVLLVVRAGGLTGFVVHSGGTYAFLMSSADALRGTSRIS